MILTSKPNISKYQIGETVYFLDGTKGNSAKIIKVQSSVTNPLDTGNGVQENLYYLEDYLRPFMENEIFHSMNALMYYLKGDYLMKLGDGEQVVLFPGSVLKGSDFSYAKFSQEANPIFLVNINLENCNFSGTDASYAKFTDSYLYGVSFRYAKLNNTFFVNSDLSSADFSNANCVGTIFTNAIMPSNADTKLKFKSVVGVGNWDSETTIWIDGLPIGN